MILSDDQPPATDSETDYSEADLDPTAKGDPDSLQVVDSDSFGPGTTFILRRCVANQDKNGDSNGVAKLRLAADGIRSASPGQSFATYQASRRELNTDITQGRSLDLEATSEGEYPGIDIFIKDTQDKSNAGARSSRRQKLSDIHQNNSTFDGGISADNDTRDHAQPLQLDVTAAHQQSDPATESPPAAHRARKSAPRRACRKHPYSSSVRPATAISTTSTVPKSTNLKRRQTRAPARDPSQEQQLDSIDDGSTDDLGDEDYDSHSDASSKTAENSPPPKRLRRAKDSSTTYHHIERDSSCLVELSNQDVATTPSTATPQSEEIPISGFLTLKTFKSKVIYCLSFSQELSPQLGGTSVSRSGDRRDSEQSPLQEQATSTHVRHSKFSPQDDKLLRRLKEDECLSWDEIAEQFPERSKGTLQVHYSTKLKRRSGTTQKAKKRWRSK